MLTAIIVGAGHRALGYAQLAEVQPDKLKIVGIADPLPERRKYTMERFGFSEDMCFENAAELAAKGKLADVIINGTMDDQHVDTTIPLLEVGYDVLLEKPFAINAEELTALDEAVKRTGRKVMICHVLRYAPFYVEIKKRLLAGEIGKIVDIQTAEHVSYHHFTMGYVRGKWNNQVECGASSLLAKCCHDIDLITWFMSGIQPEEVDSMGGLKYFTPENAPEGAGEYCLLDCPLVDKCDYSARCLHLNHPKRWASYVWPQQAYCKELDSDAVREEALKDRNHPYAKCVFKCNNDQPDRQSVIINFANGAVATHSMVGNTARPMRKVHIIGTEGEIEGRFDDNKFVIRHRDLRPGCEYTEELVDIGNMGDTTGAMGGHGGGDLRLVMDFVEFVQNGNPSISCTQLTDSINGHMIVFAADFALQQKRRIDLQKEFKLQQN